MEPFANKPQRHSKLHWWIVSGVSAAFLVWQLDLVPRVRSAATGSVSTKAQNPQETTDSFLEEDWSDIRDESNRDESDSEELNSEDPLVHAIAESKHQNAQGSAAAARSPLGRSNRTNRSTPDTLIQQTSFDPDATKIREATPVSKQQPPVLSAEIASRLRQIDEFLESDQVLEAHQEMSDIYWKHPEYRPLIQEQIDETAVIIFIAPDRQFAEPHFVGYGETLGAIAKEYDVPWQYLARLNRVDPENLQAGQQLKVVRGPFGAVVDLSDFCLTIHAHGWYVHRYSVGIGAEDGTPVGEFRIQEKLDNPTWYNPDGGVVDADDPENPLGEYWLGLGDHIGIHGTIDPDSIGKAVSRGCVHLGDSDIEEVYSLLSVGSKVMIRR